MESKTQLGYLVPLHYVAPPFILIADNIYLRRMDLDGNNYRSLLTYYYIHSMDYDYKYVQLIIHSALVTASIFIGGSMHFGQTGAVTE